MPFDPEYFSRFAKVIRQTMSMLLLIVLFSLLQYIFDMHFVCSCVAGLHLNGVLYVLLPPLILTFVVKIIEPFYQRKIFFNQDDLLFRRCCHSCFGHYFLKLGVRYVSLAALWLSLVFFDGDWYFCLKTNFNLHQTGMPCRNNLTYEEQLIRDHYKTESLDIGLFVCCGFLFLWSIAEVLQARCTPGHRCCPPYYRVVYKNLLAEAVSKNLEDELQKIARKKAETVCAHYVEVIRSHEHRRGDGDDSRDISDVWKTISVPNFFKTEGECGQRTENIEANEKTQQDNKDLREL